MKWNSNDKGFVPYWKRNTVKRSTALLGSKCYCADFRAQGFGSDFVCGHCTGEDASLAEMEQGIVISELARLGDA